MPVGNRLSSWRRGALPAGLSVFLLSVVLLLTAAYPAAGEADVRIDLVSSLYDAHTLESDLYASRDEWRYGAVAGVAFMVMPSFSFDENFQADCRIDVTFLKDYRSPDISASIGELMIDLLFFERLSFQTGFLKLDYGFQSHFHPLAVTKLLPEFRDLFGRISVGGTDRGFKGVPGLGMDFTLPELLPGFTVNLRQRIALLDSEFRHFERNFFISDIRGSFSDISFGVLCGWTPESFAGRSEAEQDNPPAYKRHPVYGANLSVVLPLQFTLLWEGTLRDESVRPFADYDAVRSFRKAGTATSETGGVFLSSDLRLEWNTTLEAEHSLSCTAEYFYNGEGLSTEMYDELKAFLDAQPEVQRLTLYAGDTLILPEALFRHYVMGSIQYRNTSLDAGLGYQCVWAPVQGIVEHRVSMSKLWNDVTLALSGIFSTGEERFRPVFRHTDFSVNAFISVTM